MKNEDEDEEEDEEEDEDEKEASSLDGSLWLVGAVLTGIVSHHLYHDVFISLINGIFWPISWIYWVVTKSVTLTILKEIALSFL